MAKVVDLGKVIGPQGVPGAAGATGPQGNPTTVNGKSGASITLTAADVGALPKTGGSMSGAISMQANPITGASVVHLGSSPGIGIKYKGNMLELETFEAVTVTNTLNGGTAPIKNISAPVETGDAANKGYVDGKVAGHTHTAAQVGAVPTTRKVNGNTLTGDVTLTAFQVGALPTTGGTLNGEIRFVCPDGSVALNLDYGKIVKVYNPSDLYDAANKGYVDGKTLCGTADPGASSSLATGVMYLVYE